MESEIHIQKVPAALTILLPAAQVHTTIGRHAADQGLDLHLRVYAGIRCGSGKGANINQCGNLTISRT